MLWREPTRRRGLSESVVQSRLSIRPRAMVSSREGGGPELFADEKAVHDDGPYILARRIDHVRIAPWPQTILESHVVAESALGEVLTCGDRHHSAATDAVSSSAVGSSLGDS